MQSPVVFVQLAHPTQAGDPHEQQYRQNQQGDDKEFATEARRVADEGEARRPMRRRSS